MYQLSKILQRIDSTNIIIGADVNGVSPMWTTRTITCDDRGKELEELIAETAITPVNKAGQACTYNRGNRDIDVTLTGESLLNKVKQWTVQEGWTTSDHNVIVIDLENDLGGNQEDKAMKNRRFNVARVDWKNFKKILASKSEELTTMNLHSTNDIDSMVERVTKYIRAAARITIPKKKPLRNQFHGGLSG